MVRLHFVILLLVFVIFSTATPVNNAAATASMVVCPFNSCQASLPQIGRAVDDSTSQVRGMTLTVYARTISALGTKVEEAEIAARTVPVLDTKTIETEIAARTAPVLDIKAVEG